MATLPTSTTSSSANTAATDQTSGPTPGSTRFGAGRLDDLAVHPTVKPVALVADAMRDCSRRGDIVLDPFMGSGTTILAAERVGRRAYGIEIDPLYVDAAIRRWQTFTKRDAILRATGETFDEVTLPAPPAGTEGEMSIAQKPERFRDFGCNAPRKIRQCRLWQAAAASTPGKPGRAAIRKAGPKARKTNRRFCERFFSARSRADQSAELKKITVLEGILLRMTEDSSRATPRARRFFSIVTPRWFQANCNDKTSATTIGRCWKRSPNESRRRANNRSRT